MTLESKYYFAKKLKITLKEVTLARVKKEIKKRINRKNLNAWRLAHILESVSR
jgi:hypothetical protein